METISTNKRKARKEHICDTCRSYIYKGEEYEISTNKDGGVIYTWINCYHCKPIVERMFREGFYPSGATDQDFRNFIADNEIDFKRR